MNRSRISVCSLHLFRVVQAAWAFALLAFLTPAIIANMGLISRGSIYICSFILFAISSYGIFRGYRWAWIISIAFLASYWLLYGWVGWANFVVNAKMFFTGHELYQDSPGTILAVLIRAIFGIVPATCLLILGVISGDRIVRILRNKPMQHFQPGHSPEIRQCSTGN